MNHFFVRKVSAGEILARVRGDAGGGVGTLDEAFETLTLVQCHKLERFPIVAMGSEFWGELRKFVRQHSGLRADHSSRGP